ncbi:MAG TPA: type II secretion system protein [Anaerohalosphaeraceae bacterium]|nr:type II secretion system protein [Anaerohalosphaeraceae bacterium]
MNRHQDQSKKPGFTLVEVAAALVILSMLISSALVVMSRITAGMIDLQSETQAFSIARQNLEKLLSATTVSDMTEYGVVETNPDMDWEIVVEPFYEPISNRMWIRGLSSASYTDSSGERKTIELTCWLTGLTAQQIRQILEQQKRQEEFMEQYSESEEGRQLAKQRALTRAYLEQNDLDVAAYDEFIERLERRRLDYIAENGFDEGYYEFLEELSQEESDFLYRLGVDYDDYTTFYDQYKDVESPDEIDTSEKPKEDVKTPDDTPDDPDSKTDPEKDTPTDNNSDNSISPELRINLKEKLGLTDEQIDKMFGQ